MTGWRRQLFLVLVASTGLLGGCQYLPPLPSISIPGNPFAAAPTPEPPNASAQPSPVAVAASPSPAFTPFWVKNHRLTEMWSAQADGPGAVSFGTTSAQFCSFQVVQAPSGPRLYVLNPYTANYLWIDADAVGPVPNPPERKAEPKPQGQNCAEAIYEG